MHSKLCSYMMLPLGVILLLTISPIYGFEWNYINYTWRSPEEYNNAINSQKYIIKNNIISGIKFYGDTLYLTNPRYLPGTPVTLSAVSTSKSSEDNPLLSPYPSWEMNVQESCDTLQNVQGMEIDTKGIMWVVDGVRAFPNATNCPPKIFLLDLNKGGSVVETVTLPEHVCKPHGCFAVDLVIDETDGGYAYITDTSTTDSGLIIYSRAEKRVWKLREKSMRAEEDANEVRVNGNTFKTGFGPSGIALSPACDLNRKVFYTSLNSYNIYSIPTKFLKSDNCDWKNNIKKELRKSSVGHGMIIDSNGDLYTGQISTKSVAKWNIYSSNSCQTIYKFDDTFIWPDTFAVDSNNNVNVVTNQLYIPYYNLPMPLDRINFKIWTLQTGYKNYMYAK